MRILFLDSPAFAKQDMIDAFTACGITCDLFFHEAYNDRQNVSYEEKFDAAVSRFSYDFVFSFNYFPILSNCCMKHHLKYISYVYDSPLVTLYSYTLINSCNYVFLFDKATYLEFHNAGIPTVYYLPLAANVSRLSAMKCPDALLPQVSSDVSFVGSLYNEEHNLFERLNGLSDYTKGYLDSIMLAQQKVYGYFFLEDLLTPPILEDLQAACPYQPLPDGTNPRHLYMPTTSCAGKLHPTSACLCCAWLPTAFHSNCIHTIPVLFSQMRSTSVPLTITTRCPTFFSTAAST